MEAQANKRCYVDSIVKLAPPIYPSAALTGRLDGFVRASFDLDGSGSSRNIRIVLSEPPGIFDKAVLVSLTNTQFKTGVIQTKCNQVFTFKFRAQTMQAI